MLEENTFLKGEQYPNFNYNIKQIKEYFLDLEVNQIEYLKDILKQYKNHLLEKFSHSYPPMPVPGTPYKTDLQIITESPFYMEIERWIKEYPGIVWSVESYAEFLEDMKKHEKRYNRHKRGLVKDVYGFDFEKIKEHGNKIEDLKERLLYYEYVNKEYIQNKKFTIDIENPKDSRLDEKIKAEIEFLKLTISNVKPSESVTLSANDEKDIFPERVRFVGTNIEMIFKSQYVVNEIGGWIIGSDKHFCGQIVALTKSEYIDYRKYVSIVPYGELMKKITDNLHKSDTLKQKIDYLNSIKSKYEFDKAYPTGDNTFIDRVNELLEKYYKLQNSIYGDSDSKSEIIVSDHVFYNNFNFEIINIANHILQISDIDLKIEYINWLLMQANERYDERLGNKSEAEQQTIGYKKGMQSHNAIIRFAEEKLKYWQNKKDEGHELETDKVNIISKTEEYNVKIKPIQWLGNKLQLTKLFELLSIDGFIPKYSKNEILIHFVNDKGEPFVNKSNKETKALHWEKTDGIFLQLVNLLVDKKLIPKYKKYLIFLSHFNNNEFEEFKNPAQSHHFKKTFLNPDKQIEEIVSQVSNFHV
jgi:hypothetical protein